MAGAIVSLGFATAGQALAAETPDTLCKGGQLVSMRVNILKGADKAAAYDSATRNHIGWYRSKGITQNRLLVGPVLVRNADGSWSNSTTERVSIHMNSPGVPADKRDAGWDAYVSEYRATSDISTEKYACVREPK
jgi:hypothetical protein